jgi:hypothetical protein
LSALTITSASSNHAEHEHRPGELCTECARPAPVTVGWPASFAGWLRHRAAAANKTLDAYVRELLASHKGYQPTPASFIAPPQPVFGGECDPAVDQAAGELWAERLEFATPELAFVQLVTVGIPAPALQETCHRLLDRAVRAIFTKYGEAELERLAARRGDAADDEAMHMVELTLPRHLLDFLEHRAMHFALVPNQQLMQDLYESLLARQLRAVGQPAADKPQKKVRIRHNRPSKR